MYNGNVRAKEYVLPKIKLGKKTEVSKWDTCMKYFSVLPFCLGCFLKHWTISWLVINHSLMLTNVIVTFSK